MANTQGRPVTAVVNQKGGVGKTLVAQGLAHAAAAMCEAEAVAAVIAAAEALTQAAAETATKAEVEAKAAAQTEAVLLLDADPQGNLTAHLTGHTMDSPPERGCLADVLDRRTRHELEDVLIQARTRDSLWVVPTVSPDLQAVADSLQAQPGADNSIRLAIERARTQGRVLIDTRPALDLLTRAAMLASDNLVVVVEPEYDSATGLAQTLRAVADLEKYMKYRLPIAGVVINGVDGTRNDHAEIIDYLRKYCDAAGLPILGDPIPMLTIYSKLNVRGLGMDQDPSRSITASVLAKNFTRILEGIDAAERAITV